MNNGSPSDSIQYKLIQKMLDSNRKDSSKNTSTSSRKFDLEICIDIGDGTTGVIKFDSNSNVGALESALEFCREYGVDEGVAPLIAESIVNQMKKDGEGDGGEQEKLKESRIEIVKGTKVGKENLKKVRNGSMNKNNTSSNNIKNRKKSVSKCSSPSPMLRHRLSQSLVQQVRPELKQITNRFNNQKHKRRQQSLIDITMNKSRKNTEPTKQKEYPKQVEQEFNYHPKINQISKQIVEKLNKKSLVSSVEDNQKKKEQKMTKIRKQNDIKQIIECSFKPKINLISEKVDNEMKRSILNRYQQLYMNSFIQQKSKQHSRKTSFQKNTFKPQINKISKTIMTGISFQQRQQKFKKKPSSQLINVFKPKTGRQPKQRNTQQLPIGDYLYEKGREKMRIRDRNCQTQNNSRRGSIVSNKSEELFNNLKINKLREIFELLDYKESGVLECDDLQLGNLDPETLNIFIPIFEQMREIEVSLNLEQFIEAGSRLIQNLTPQERGVLFNIKKKADAPEEYSFQPKINKSIKMNEDMQRERNRKDIYVRCLMQKKMHKERIQHSKQELIKNQLYQCTFKPRINRIDKYIL